MAGREVPMSVRLAIAEADTASLNVSGFCRDHGISRDTFYEVRRRYEEEGLAGLQPRSRAPHHVANRTAVEVEDLIIEIRKELDGVGLDAGPASIQYWLGRRLVPDEVCSESTIWRVLSRRGFIVADPSKAPGRRWRSFAAARANECWQMDATHWFLADGTEVEIISALDDCSRVALRCLAVMRCTQAGVWETVTEAAERYGWPEWMLTDNAKYFGTALAENLAAVGVRIGHSRPYHPQTCGKVERFQQTLKKWLAAHDPAANLAELQDQLDEFVDYYNTQRPHRSLGRRTPSEVWQHTPHSGPANQPLGRPSVVYRNRVYDGIVWAGRYRIALGVAHNDARTTTITTGTQAHVFINGRLVRELTINPDRPNQPLYKRPGRPT
jgi:transposase InsO family protein